MPYENEEICYLCGDLIPGIERTKDHVPPKSFLPSNANTIFITLPAHKKCNNEKSLDEEYLRDLIGPSGFDFKDGQEIYRKTQRAWKRPQGKRRLEGFLKNAVNVSMYSKHGVYLGKGIGIKTVDWDRVGSVGAKIAKGIVFLDCKTRISTLHVTHIPTYAVRQEREKELETGNPFWLSLNAPNCKHTNFSESVMVRRVYILETVDPLVFSFHMIIAIYSQSFIVVGSVDLKEAPSDFPMICFDSSEFGKLPAVQEFQKAQELAR